MNIDSNPTSQELKMTHLTEGRIRRQLIAELSSIRSEISHWDKNDDLTKEIKIWEKNFSQALKSSIDEQSICERFISLLQDLFRDPITKAPLDGQSVLGNDGFTYGQMSLAIYQMTISPEYRDCSPLDLSVSPFTTIPHRVARHMIHWLEMHNALLYSAEVERNYLNLLPQQPLLPPSPLSKEDQRRERVNRLVVKLKEKKNIEERLKQEQKAKFDQQVLKKLKLLGSELKDMVKPFTQSPYSINAKEILTQNSAKTAVVEDRLREIQNRETHAIENINQRISTAEKKNANSLGMPEINSEEAFNEDQASLERLKQKINEQIGTAFQPLKDLSANFVQNTAEELEAISQKHNKEKKILESAIQTIRTDIQKLEEKRQELICSQQYLSKEIEQLQIDEKALQQQIIETKIAFEQKKEKSSQSFLNTIAIIGGCMFVTWAIQSIMSTTQFTIFPLEKGLQIRTSIPL